MIPKIIHYCWLSNDPFPESIQYCIDSWKEKLPDYEIMLWNFDRFPKGTSKWVDEAFAAKKYAFAADYIRLYALYNYGGIYLDSDVEVLKSFDDFLCLPYFIGRENTPSGIEAATIGCEKGFSLMKHMLDRYQGRSFYKEDGHIDDATLPSIFRDTINKYYKINEINSISEFISDDGLINIFPVDWFSPKTWDTRELKLTENTRSIHHFEGSWKKTNKNTSVSTKATMPLISVVIPVYKVEEYLDQCVQSVIDQTYKNLEIILVDDGSPDTCPQKCEEWAKKDSRIKVVHQKNAGLSAARNSGIKVAKGEYIGLVDSDDYIAPTMYEKLYHAFSMEENLMITSCLFYMEENNEIKLFAENLETETPILVRGKDYARSKMLLLTSQMAWNKLYKAELFQEQTFREGLNNEDMMFSFDISKVMKKHAYNEMVIPDHLYYYRRRPESICTTKKRIFQFDIVENLKTLMYESKGDQELMEILNIAYGKELPTTVHHLLHNTEIAVKQIRRDVLEDAMKAISRIKEINEGTDINSVQEELNRTKIDLENVRKKNDKHLKAVRILIIACSVLTVALLAILSILLIQ